MQGRTLILLAVALLVGSAAAFTWTEKLKLEPSPIADPSLDRRFSPGCDCRHETAALSFRLRQADRLEVVVVDEDDRVVSTLAEDLERRRGRVELEWDGRDEANRIVPDGAYQVRVRLERAERTILIPVKVRVDSTPAEVRLLGTSDTTLSLAGQEVEFRYTATEAGRPLLLVNGKVAVHGRTRAAGRSTLTWDGAIRSKSVAAGEYRASLVVVDRVGNRSEPTKPVTIVVT